MDIQERKDFIKEMRSKRMGYREIGELLGISRQRAHQICTGYQSKCPNPTTVFSGKNIKKIDIDGINITKVTKMKSGSRNRLRELIRIRDNRTCQICFKQWAVGEKRLDVHHLDEDMEGLQSGEGNIKWDREHTDRMITLCHRCHLRLDHLRPKFMKKLSTA